MNVRKVGFRLYKCKSSERIHQTPYSSLKDTQSVRKTKCKHDRPQNKILTFRQENWAIEVKQFLDVTLHVVFHILMYFTATLEMKKTPIYSCCCDGWALHLGLGWSLPRLSCKVIYQPNMPVFGLWEEGGAPGRNPDRQRENMRTPHNWNNLIWDWTPLQHKSTWELNILWHICLELFAVFLDACPNWKTRLWHHQKQLMLPEA